MKAKSDLEKRIYERVLARTSGRIKQLHVSVKDEKAAIWGYVPSPFLKEQAMRAVEEIVGSKVFEEAIEIIDETEKKESPLMAIPW